MSNIHLDPYDFLGVSPNCSLNDVKKSYYSLALLMHPDKGGSPTEMHILKTAYNWIREQITLVETNPFKDYESIQKNFDDFIKQQDESKPSPLTTILAESIGFEFDKFTQLYDKILAQYSHNLNHFNNKDYIYSIMYSDIHNSYIRNEQLIISNEKLWEYVEHELIHKWINKLNKVNSEDFIPSSILHGYGADMQESTVTANNKYNPDNVLYDDTIKKEQKEVIIYTEPKDLSEYNELRMTVDKIPEKLTNYTYFEMTDYKEAFSDVSDINANLKKSLEHINITDNVTILMKKKIKERNFIN